MDAQRGLSQPAGSPQRAREATRARGRTGRSADPARKLVETSAEHEALIVRATALLPDCARAYSIAPDAIRRDYNLSWFKKIFIIDEDGTVRLTVFPA
jgi:hypothetical protein